MITSLTGRGARRFELTGDDQRVDGLTARRANGRGPRTNGHAMDEALWRNVSRAPWILARRLAVQDSNFSGRGPRRPFEHAQGNPLSASPVLRASCCSTSSGGRAWRRSRWTGLLRRSKRCDACGSACKRTDTPSPQRLGDGSSALVASLHGRPAAPPPGFEPEPSEPKSEVLPLHHGGQVSILARAALRPCPPPGSCGNAMPLRGTLAGVLGVDLTMKATRPADPIGGTAA